MLPNHLDVVLNSRAKPKAVGFPCAPPFAPPCAMLVLATPAKHSNYKTWHRQGFLRLYYALDAMFP